MVDNKIWQPADLNPDSNFPGTPDYEMYETDYDYEKYRPNNKITLAKVPWDLSYNDINFFTSVAERDKWFEDNGKVKYQNITSTLIPGDDVYIDMPYTDANQYNYLVIDWDDSFIPGASGAGKRKYFFFITSFEYISNNCTKITVQEDVIQTWLYDIEFTEMCFLNRGHYAQWMAPTPQQWFTNNRTNSATWEMSLAPEGLDYGNEYEVADSTLVSFQQYSTSMYIVLTITSDIRQSSWGSLETPNLATARGGIFDGIPSSSDVWAILPSEYTSFVSYMSQYPWISQNIQVLTAVPGNLLSLSSTTVTVGGATLTRVDASSGNGYAWNVDIPWIDSSGMPDLNIPTRYRHLTKLYTFPYMMFELTDNAGQSLVYKPEGIQMSSRAVTYQGFGVATPPYTTFVIYPNYNGMRQQKSQNVRLMGSNSSKEIYYNNNEFLDSALVMRDFPKFSILNNSYLNYLASGAYSRAYAYDAADWSYTKATTGAQLSYNQAQSGIETQLQNMQYQLGANNDMNELNNFQSIAGGVVGGAQQLLSGNVLGVVATGVNTAIQVGANNRSTAIQNNLMGNLTRSNANQSQYVADTNLEFANFAASGDKAMAVSAINSKVQDAKILSPSVSGNAGGDGLLMSNGFFGFMVKVKRIRDDYIRMIGETWLRYGYYWQKTVKPPKSLMTHSNFTYWQFGVVYLNSAGVPESRKEAIRGIFQRGTTVWQDPSKLGRIDPYNNIALGALV